ncbi:probable bifunctional methylthioribulose-1-phosphate dehydratase/enolase-phosphatase E1 isoform X1 [Lolium perenne]|uniref:probable bifunctional methylthioribulose-1-phosphate dehydratase/enolase-phosphatase E1 isoform X1 n=1 Tax=Lolium perenne TaxID=4522 RepID=UPI0021EA1862
MSTGGAEAASAAAEGMASAAYLAGDAVREARELVAELCRHFYLQGWVTGTGGSITVKANDPAVPLAQQLIVMSPSGVQKERMVADDMYVMAADGKIISAPRAKPWPHKHPKCSDCAPLFMKSYLMRGAGAVIHSHGMETCMATMLVPGAKEFRMTHMEMIKGIKGHGYRDELVIPIIENTPYEYELTDSLAEAIKAYPKATAVLVRNHGIYVWGDSWINAKTQAECYHYLLDAAVKMYQLGIDWTTPEHGPINSAKRLRTVISPDVPNGAHAAKSSKRCVVLDIEGTTTPISFVTDVMFPYARDNVRKHLISTYDSEETKEDIELLRIQVEEDLRNGVVGAVSVAPSDAGKEEVINSLVTNVESMIKADRKITSLKQLQGHIWRTGFESKELHGVVFEDVPGALKDWQSHGVKVYIYSSGSREAQRLLFGHSSHGDLRQYLCGFFDTTTGNKREARSYFEITKSLGVDKPSEILFITDVFEEAVAAKSAGLDVIISIRPGNAPLPENHGFRTISSFSEI